MKVKKITIKHYSRRNPVDLLCDAETISVKINAGTHLYGQYMVNGSERDMTVDEAISVANLLIEDCLKDARKDRMNKWLPWVKKRGVKMKWKMREDG